MDRFVEYTGGDLAPRLQSSCGVESSDGATCDRIEGHAGEHVEVSGIGLVLSSWGSEDADGTIDARTREVIEKLARIRDELTAAIQDADWALRDLRSEYADDEVLVELIDDSETPDEYVEIGLSENEKDWPDEIRALRERVARRKKSAA
ncbi:hypothetical protein F8M49_29930 [Rhodococcus zopfii]|uniref:Uncharacterized protein n=1 Tax=Rhodococcus zopfii TaxID=43772 RepID=A0ABU3WXU4_9NOCA|nr:hypothetical protein [Rhodococcus zopfii]MDV2478582.1 hypothetical protein [Rhodococcus zopfii]